MQTASRGIKGRLREQIESKRRIREVEKEFIGGGKGIVARNVRTPFPARPLFYKLTSDMQFKPQQQTVSQ